MDQFDACIGAVASSLVNALAAGSVVLAIVFIVCRLFPRIPPAIRFGLWWLGCAKILLSLICSLSIPLVVTIPQSVVPRFTAPKSAVQAVWRRITPVDTGAQIRFPSRAAADGKTSADAERRTGETVATGQAVAGAPPEADSVAPLRSLAVDLLVAAWLAGCLIKLVSLCRSGIALRRLLRTTVLSAAPYELRELSRRIGVRASPVWRTSSQLSSPLSAGFVNPLVVFPSDFAESFSSGELRLAIAHELAHIRRCDVWLSLVPTIARCLFFFHPLVLLAHRECENCREEACDAIALAATAADPAQYAALLLKTALSWPPAAAEHAHAAPGMAAAHFAQLKRRLEAVRTGARPWPAALTGAVLSLTSLAIVVPYRIVLAASARLKLAPEATILPRYILRDLGTLGGRSSDAMAISENGEIVGSANNDRHNTSGHAFLYDNDRGMRDLGESIPYRHSVAAAINIRGQVVANAFDRNGRALSVVWDNGIVRALQSLSGYRFSRPAAISDNGDVAGTAQNPWPDARGAFRTRAIVYSGGTARDLGTLGGPYSAATSINGAGEVAGKADLPAGRGETPTTHAFVSVPPTLLGRSRPAALRDLGVLPGGTNSVATAINDAHEIAGVSEISGGAHHAFVEAGGGMRDLGTLPGTDSSRAYAISKGGAVVGTAYSEGGNAPGNRRAVLWLPAATKDGTPKIVDLNDLLPAGSRWVLECARGVNSRGQIVGQGTIDGEHRAFLLTPQ